MNSIELLMLDGIAKRLKRVFQLKQDPIDLPITDYKHYLNALAKEQGKDVSYPMVFFSLNNIAFSEHAAPLQAELLGQYTAMSRSGDTIANISLIPTTFTFDLTVLDNSHVSMMSFLSKWMRYSLSGALSFDVNFDGLKVSMQVIMERSASVPKKEINVDEANHFEFTTTFTVNGYLSGDYDEEKVNIARLDRQASQTDFYTPTPPAQPLQPSPQPNQPTVPPRLLNQPAPSQNPDGLPTATPPKSIADLWAMYEGGQGQNAEHLAFQVKLKRNS